MATDNPNMPWSLVGVSDEARHTVRMAAAESGQTIGQWLNARILEAAAIQLEGPAAHPGHTGGATRAILDRLQQIVSDSEDFSNDQIEAFHVALQILAIRMDDLENPENTGE